MSETVSTAAICYTHVHMSVGTGTVNMYSGQLPQPLNPEMNIAFGRPSMCHVFIWGFVLPAGSIRTVTQIHTLELL